MGGGACQSRSSVDGATIICSSNSPCAIQHVFLLLASIISTIELVAETFATTIVKNKDGYLILAVFIRITPRLFVLVRYGLFTVGLVQAGNLPRQHKLTNSVLTSLDTSLSIIPRLPNVQFVPKIMMHFKEHQCVPPSISCN